MTSRSYFGKMNSILGSVVPLAMFKHQPEFVLIIFASSKGAAAEKDLGNVVLQVMSEIVGFWSQ